jgi:hypothetical protein
VQGCSLRGALMKFKNVNLDLIQIRVWARKICVCSGDGCKEFLFWIELKLED